MDNSLNFVQAQNMILVSKRYFESKIAGFYEGKDKASSQQLAFQF